MKRFGLMATFAALALFVRSDRAFAQLGTGDDGPACCNVSAMLAHDAIRGNDLSGDERFFMTPGAPPNIHFIVDTSGSMRELPQVKNSNHVAFFNSGYLDLTSPGCANVPLDAEADSRDWDPAKSYPPIDYPGTGLGSDKGFPNLFVETKFYDYMSWEDSTSPTARGESTVEAVCANLHTDTTLQANCKKCLVDKGYYRKVGTLHPDPDDTTAVAAAYKNFVFSGKFLNFNPPKYVILKKVLREVVKDLKRMRAGYSIFDGNDGGQMPQKQNPSCSQIAKDSSSFDNNRASYINDLLDLRFSGNTPLAETLFNVGQYFSSSNDVYEDVYGFDSTYLKKTGGVKKDYSGDIKSEGRGWCWGCQTSSVIIISDGEPSEDNNLPRQRLIELNGVKDLLGNKTSVKCPGGACWAAEEAKQNDLLDDVAKFLHEKDLQIHTPVIVGDMNTAGTQTMNIYGISLGHTSPILKNATREVGGGEYYEAKDATQLKQAILDVLQQVNVRATAFAAASVASLQVNRTGGSVLPRFKPARGGLKQPWQGFLYRFEIDTERRNGCDPTQAATILTGGAGDSNDVNQDGDCNDLHLYDNSSTKQPVVEDDQGNFVHLKDPTKAAVPYWEAGALMNSAENLEDWKRREIWTVVDDSGDGKIDKNDTPIAFNVENAAKLAPYMGIADNTPQCLTLKTQLGLSAIDAKTCAEIVIKWYRGADVLNSEVAKREQDRPFLLHDIFHSAPIIVEPLSDKLMCGVGGQCLHTLFEGKTPLEKTDGKDAYEKALETYGIRDRVVLVGSNGGMLHAFNNGQAIGTDEAGMIDYNTGTGEELWAFVPPDLLAKMRNYVGKHGYFVDGTAMVRDVWLDENNDGTKQASEFRTVAITGEGSGGTRRFALDLTEVIGNTGSKGEPRDHRPPKAKGDFLWMWPQSCDELEMAVGESTGNFAPKPPPIGPVAMASEDGPFEFPDPTATAGEAVLKAKEHWVAFFNGGDDSNMLRGRGLAMVDVGTGETLWSVFGGDGRTNSGDMKYPFMAAVAMMDLGNSNSSAPDQDLLFDTATVADYGGNVWTVRFWLPGKKDESTKKIENWFAARSFQIEASSTNAIRPAFTQMTSNTLQPDTGYLRTYIGSGDRNNLPDMPGDICRISNGRACAKQGCTVERQVRVERGGSLFWERDVHFESGTWKEAHANDGTGGDVCSGTKVTFEYKHDKSTACEMDLDGKTVVECDGTSGGWSCSTVQDDWLVTNFAQKAGTLPTASPHRFYGFWSYGVKPARTFNTKEQADAFDNSANLLKDSNLKDVTAIDTAGFPTNGAAGQLDNGWYVKYTPLNERTGSGSTILDGCVFWNSFEPGEGAALCATAGANTARFYQGSYVGGAANCASTFYNGTKWSRSIDRSVVAVPGEPTPFRSVFEGEGSTSIITLEAGRSQSDPVAEQKELVQSVYELQLDRAAHDCRHESVGCK